VLNGRFGPYIKFEKNNFKIPKGTDPKELTIDDCKKIIAEGGNDNKGKAKKTTNSKKASTTKKTTATKKTGATAAKKSTTTKAKTTKAAKKTTTTKKASNTKI
jgi:DNA topoisomerase-1